jgi:hypothetical protein
MKIKKNIKIEKPIIVFAGDYGSGKTYIANKIQNVCQVGIKLNIYDFFSRYILYICNISPFQIDYQFVNDISIDYNLFKYCDKKDFLNYVRGEILNNHKMDFNLFKYLLKNIFNVNNVNNTTDQIQD